MTIFLLKLTICWGFFALLYLLLLKRETFFRANRAYLLGTAALGILLAALPAEQMPLSDEAPVMLLPAFTVGLSEVELATKAWSGTDYMWLAYWAGFSLALARILWGLFLLTRMAVRGNSERLPDGCLLIQTREAKVPFSFFKWVFVPASIQLSESLKASESSESYAAMIAHERAHAQGWHSADVLLAELLCAALWFHPLAHWYRLELRAVHEYLADAEAASQSDKKQYGLLLIGQSQSGMPIAFANHFFQSPLKQRLVMLTKKASSPLMAIKFGLVAPLAILFAMLFRQAPAIAQAVDEKHRAFVQDLEAKGWAMTDTVVTFDPVTYEETVQYVRNHAAPQKDENGKLVYQYAEVQPEFPGGQEALVKYLSENLKYPASAEVNGIEGKVIVSFVVDESGNVVRPWGQIDMPNDAKYPLVAEAVRVVQAMPRWIPAKHKDKTVQCSMKLPVVFSLGNTASKSAEAQPEFPGGMAGLAKYLGENLKYPETAKASKAEGTAFVEFVVKEDGSLEAFRVKNTSAIHPDLAAEAIRVVQSMPKWKPGVKEGKVVKAQFIIPIKFKL